MEFVDDDGELGGEAAGEAVEGGGEMELDLVGEEVVDDAANEHG